MNQSKGIAAHPWCVAAHPIGVAAHSKGVAAHQKGVAAHQKGVLQHFQNATPKRCATTFFGCETNSYDQNTHFHIFGFLVAQAHMVDPTTPGGALRALNSWSELFLTIFHFLQ